MESNEFANCLTRIQTHWTMVFQAHQQEGDRGVSAQRQLLLRYYGAVFRYLVGIVRNPATAEELAQEFAVRFMRGDFKNADPQRGRFRDFLKTAVRHLAIDHFNAQKKERQKGPVPLPTDGFEPPAREDGDDSAFVQSWREELMAQAWEALHRFEEQSGTPHYTVLRYKTEHPEARSAQMAAVLGPRLGKTFTEATMRQMLHRAREKFAALLLDEVIRSLQTAETDRVEQELVELRLLEYCKPALRQRERSS
jgi:RNA polymerase sigma-70 factor (ECF subfamily)